MMGYTIEGVAGAARARRRARSTCSGDEAPWVAAHDRHRRDRAGRARRPATRSRSARSRSSSSTRPATRRAASASSSTARLVSGDTLFLDGCGRTDLPGSDPELMYDSLQRLADAARRHGRLPRPPLLAAVERHDVEAIREQNYVFKPTSKAQWLTMFGRDPFQASAFIECGCLGKSGWGRAASSCVVMF